jgi:hypothetical protein
MRELILLQPLRAHRKDAKDAKKSKIRMKILALYLKKLCALRVLAVKIPSILKVHAVNAQPAGSAGQNAA